MECVEDQHSPFRSGVKLEGLEALSAECRDGMVPPGEGYFQNLTGPCRGNDAIRLLCQLLSPLHDYVFRVLSIDLGVKAKPGQHSIFRIECKLDSFAGCMIGG